MAKTRFATITAWLMSKGVTDDVAPRHISIQLSEEGDTIVAVASVGEEYYLAGDAQDDIDDALDSLDDALSSEGGRLLHGESQDDDEED